MRSLALAALIATTVATSAHAACVKPTPIAPEPPRPSWWGNRNYNTYDQLERAKERAKEEQAWREYQACLQTELRGMIFAPSRVTVAPQDLERKSQDLERLSRDLERRSSADTERRSSADTERRSSADTERRLRNMEQRLQEQRRDYDRKLLDLEDDARYWGQREQGR